MQASSKNSGVGNVATSKTTSSSDEPGTIMEQIQALVRPPQNEERPRSKRSSALSSSSSSATATTAIIHDKGPTPAQRRYGRTSNHDRCDSCSEGGDLICCDRCPAAFHLYCCEPPLDPDNLPSGEWLCRKCDPPSSDVTAKPYGQLIKMACQENPVTFTLPFQYKCNTLVPGVRKRKNNEDGRGSNTFQRKNNKEKRVATSSTTDEFDQPTRRNHCALCSRGQRDNAMIQCDFCPLFYHLDCLDPPRTMAPTGTWMCPSHAEIMHPEFSSEFLSKREAVLDKMRTEFCRHETKVNFLDKVHRMKHYGRQVRHTKRTAVPIPSFIQDVYRNPLPMNNTFSAPSFAALCEAAAQARNPDHVLLPSPKMMYPPGTPSARQQQEEWLRGMIYFQCEASRYLSVAPEICWQYQQKVPENVAKDSAELKPVENGLSSNSDEEVIPKEESSGKVLGAISRASSSSDVFLDSSPTVFPQEAVVNDHGLYALPDLTLLHPDMIQILAQQRLQEILTPKEHKEELSSSSLPKASSGAVQLKLQRSDDFKKSQAILCCLGEGFPFAITKQTVTIGTSANCDLSLCECKKCQRLSDLHACIVYDKASNRFELLNYSEFGTIVDGVNYSIGTSKLKSKRSTPVSLTTNDIKALGNGPRAKRAQAKVDSSRRKWGNSSHARAFLEHLLKHPEKELSEEQTDTTQTEEKDTEASLSLPKETKQKDSSLPANKINSSLSPLCTRQGSRQKPNPPSPEPLTVEEEEEETSNVLDTCSCISAMAVATSEHSGWTGTASLHHGSVIQLGCMAYVFSIARQPGHTDLLDAILTVAKT